MNLSKRDALFLSKILFHYERLTRYEHDGLSPTSEDLDNMTDRLESFLVSGEAGGESPSGNNSDEGDDSCDHCGADHEDHPHDDDDDEEDDEEDEDEDDEPEAPPAPTPPPPTGTLSASLLHDLDPLSTDLGDLEFEDTGAGSIDILIGGNPVIEGVSILRRGTTGLEAWSEENGTYCVVPLQKVKKAWKNALKDGVVFDVVN